MSSPYSSFVGYSQLHRITGAFPKKLKPVEASQLVSSISKVRAAFKQLPACASPGEKMQCSESGSNRIPTILMKLAKCPFWKKASLDEPVTVDFFTNSSYADCDGFGSKKLLNQDEATDTHDLPKVYISQAGRSGVQRQHPGNGHDIPKERRLVKRPRRQCPPPPMPALGMHLINRHEHAMKACRRVNSMACNTIEKLQPISMFSSTVWSVPSDPKMFRNTAAEEANTKLQDASTIFLESCWSPQTCLDELSKSNDVDGKAASSPAIGAEADPLNDLEMVEVKQENPDDLIEVKPEPLPCKEDLLSETALVTGGGSKEDLSIRGPDSAGKLATCPPVSREEDLVVEAVRLIDKIRDGGTPSVFLYNCALCHYASNGKETYKKHLITHENRPKKFVCTKCEFKSRYRKSLQQHILTHSNKRAKNFCCSHCPYKTDRPSSLQRHLLIHLPNRDKPYSCAHCHFRTDIKSTLSLHVKIHDTNREKKFTCTHCLYCTHNQYSLRWHMRIHDSNRPKPFMCPQCDFRTDVKYCLQTHLLIHEKGNKQLACPLCSFTTNYKSHYKKHHYNKHLFSRDTKAKVLVCPQCPYSTHSKGHYQRHEKACLRSKFRFKVEPLNRIVK